MQRSFIPPCRCRDWLVSRTWAETISVPNANECKQTTWMVVSSVGISSASSNKILETRKEFENCWDLPDLWYIACASGCVNSLIQLLQERKQYRRSETSILDSATPSWKPRKYDSAFSANEAGSWGIPLSWKPPIQISHMRSILPLQHLLESLAKRLRLLQQVRQVVVMIQFLARSRLAHFTESDGLQVFEQRCKVDWMPLAEFEEVSVSDLQTCACHTLCSSWDAIAWQSSRITEKLIKCHLQCWKQSSFQICAFYCVCTAKKLVTYEVGLLRSTWRMQSWSARWSWLDATCSAWSSHGSRSATALLFSRSVINSHTHLCQADSINQSWLC